MSNKKKNLILALCYLAYASIYIARLNLSVGSPEFIRLEMLNKAQIGLIGSVFSVVYALGRVVNGYIGDRKPPAFMITVGLLSVAMSNIVIGLFPAYYSVLILWACNAYAQSMLWSAVLRMVVTLYDEQTAKKKVALLVTSVATGNILGILLNTYLIELWGVRFAFLIPGGLSLMFGFLFLFAVREKYALPTETASPRSFLALLKDKELLSVAAPAMIHGVLKENVSLWMTIFFAERFHIDLSAALGFLLFIPAAGFAGRAAYSILYRLCRYREHTLSVFCFALCIPASAVLAFAPLTPLSAMVCLGLVYASASVANTSFLSVFPLRYVKMGNVSSVGGLMDFVTYLGGGIGSLVFGLWINGKGGYFAMFLSWIVLSALAGGMLLAAMKKIKSWNTPA